MAGALRQSAESAPPVVGAAPLGLAALPDGFIEHVGLGKLSVDRNYGASLGSRLPYAVFPDVQLDSGIRVGLTKAKEDFGVFAGISLRY
jgi:hypothetical protein